MAQSLALMLFRSAVAEFLADRLEDWLGFDTSQGHGIDGLRAGPASETHDYDNA